MTLPTVLAATLCFTAVAVWPARADPRRRLAGLGDGPGVGTARIGPASGRATGSTPADLAGWTLSPDLVMELVACGLRAGLPVSDALAAGSAGARSAYLDAVASRLRLGVPAQSAWARPPPAYDGLARALMVADRSGAPAAAVVTRAAADHRAARRERAELAAARLGVQLVLPLGLAVLPGFILLAVVPIVIGLASGLTSAP